MSGDYVHGINKMKKPATKVMAPPGGRTSINLFGGPEEPQAHQVNRCQASRNQSSVFGAPDAVPAPVQAPKSKPAAAPTPTPAAPVQEQAKPTPAAAPTNIAIGAQGQGTQSKPSTKVMAPPGGKTSVMFG